jgi:hypothetical protein
MKKRDSLATVSGQLDLRRQYSDKGEGSCCSSSQDD